MAVMRYLLLVLCLPLMTVCDERPTGPTSLLNTEFILEPGESMRIEGAALTVRFNGVSGDSRCPADVFCIQGGDAVVRITARSDSSTHDYELHTGNMRPVQHDAITIALVQLSPYPFSSRTIQPDEYRATLIVRR